MDGSGALDVDSSVRHEWYGPSSSRAVMFTSSMLVLVVTGILVLYSYIGSAFLSLKIRQQGRPPLPPGTFGFPIIGELGSYLQGRTKFHLKRHTKYGPIFKTNVLGKLVFIQPPAGNKFVFSNEGKLVDVSWPRSIERLLGELSLLALAGDPHRLMRRHIAPFLSPQAVSQYVPRIERHLLNHLEEVWKPSAGANDSQAFEVSLTPFMKLVTFSVMADLVLSLELDEIDKMRHLFETTIAGFASLPIDFPGTTFRRALKARASLIEMVLQILSRRKSELQDGTASSTQDLMSHLITVPDDTEVDAIARTNNLPEGLTKEDLAGMKYTWSVIQETMRMICVIDVGFRKTLEDIEYGGFTIPKGWKVAWTANSHMSPEVFKDPEVFDPDRFNGSQKLPPYTYVPFGGGPHMCAGMDFAKLEMLIVLYYVTRDYEFVLVNPDEPVLYTPWPIPFQKSGILVRASKLKE